MNDDELKKLWQQQSLREPALSPTQVMSAMQSKTTQLRRTLWARDIGELAACVVVIIIFGIFYFTLSHTPASRLGDLIVIGSSIFIAGKLIHARRSNPPAPPGATTVESLRADLNAVRVQSRLLGSVLWWYLLPVGIGVLVCTWGSFNGGIASLAFNMVYTIGVIALYSYIYRLNQRARAQQLLPLEAQLESLIHSADSGEPLDETQVANLRAIVLSMAAADHVKPVEFKVAFWQLAVFGVPGIVGIWFFLMLGLTIDNKDWKTKESLPVMSVQAVYTGETNRYSIVVRKVVDLFNAGDYAGVRKLYNPTMAEAFPPKEASDFYARMATNFGKIEKFDGPTGNGYRGWTAFRLHFQNGEMMISVALDAEDQISGIHFQPEPRASMSFKLFVLRFFSWRHLVWLPFFFLAGLLYSWLIQKTTQRAVGISALGIHLHKGQTLFLWDEIKEVRQFRFLHIRNLWLIKESGEKTRMHWTPLEGHSDLKAAVEEFSPANHPIRKYLTLLRRI
jgi:hypothetical protein